MGLHMGLGFGGGGGFTGVLDGVAALAGWSVARLLTKDYAGPYNGFGYLVLLQRDSDDDEEAFGVGGDFKLDTAAVTSWAGGAGVIILEKFDQIGSTNLVAPSDAGAAPYSATGLNGFPCGDLNGTSHYWTANGLAASFSGTNQPITVSQVLNFDTMTGALVTFSLGRSTDNDPAIFLGTGAAATDYLAFRRNDTGTSLQPDSPNPIVLPAVQTIVSDGSTVTWKNSETLLTGINGASWSVGAMTVDRLAVGCLLRGAASSFMNGQISETILFDSAVSDSVRDRVHTNQRNFYDLPVMGTLLAASTQKLPDAQGGDLNEGFTCTGLTYDPVDLNWWCGNDGRNLDGDVTYEPSLVQVSLNGVTLVDEIDVGTLFASAESVQGVAYDTSDDTLWFCSKAENLIRHVTKAGADIADEITKTGPNGLCYDSQRDRLWYTQDSTLFRITKTGTQEFSVVLGFSDVDQLSYDAVSDLVWISSGANGSLGNVWGYSPSLARFTQVYKLTSATAIEGAYLLGSTMYVLHDGYFHSTTPGENQLQTYTI